MNREKCPFRVGDRLVYRPRPQSQVPERKTEPKLKKGYDYKAVKIDADECVVLEGFENEGGIYWDDFFKDVPPSNTEIRTEKCPFKVGDIVVYQPTIKGRGSVIMTDLAALKPGNKYKVVRIDIDICVVAEGFENSTGGGLYWTEFSALKPGECPFNVGDTVVYRPSSRGHALDVMIDPQLERGEKYKIARIDEGVSVVVEGFENAVRGGIYWTEFSAETV